jgi:hypothetical protein
VKKSSTGSLILFRGQSSFGAPIDVQLQTLRPHVTRGTRSLAWLFTVLTAIRRWCRYTAKHLTGHRTASVTCLNSVACHQGCTASAGITLVARIRLY